MSKKIFAVLVLVALLVLPSIVLAPSPWGDVVDFDAVDLIKIFFGPDVPEAFTTTPYNILQWLIFPFLALWVIIFGIMSEIRIFRRGQNIRIVLSFLIAIMAAPTGALVWVVKTLFALYGGFAFVIFIVLMFVGTALWGMATWGLWGSGSLLKQDTWKKAGDRMKTSIKRQEKIRRLQEMARDSSIPESKRIEAADEAMRLIKEEQEEMGGT